MNASALRLSGDRPIDRAVAGGMTASGVGPAFVAGYREALRQLVPAVGDRAAALCVTESGGNHPRAIACRLERDGDGDGYRLTGDKAFVTLGTRAELLLVAAREGEDAGGRPRLALVAVPAARAGVALTPLPELGFVPDVPHASVHFEDVRVEPGERLAGDGWADYVKPFRTVEDLHVHGALLGWLIAVGLAAGWDDAVVEQLAAASAAVRALAIDDPRSPAVHIALAGVIAMTRRVAEDADWAAVDSAVRAGWERDRRLLDVAGKARVRRREVAWQIARG